MKAMVLAAGKGTRLFLLTGAVPKPMASVVNKPIAQHMMSCRRRPKNRNAHPTLGVDVRSLVIIPTYNERENLPRLVPAVLEKDDSLDVLVVDDGSPDGTGEVAESLARKTGRVRVMHRSGKQGLGTAYVAGFRYALGQGYDRVVQMDADFSHRPEDLPRLLEATEFADVVVGSRNVPGGRVEDWSLLRRFVSKGGSLYSRILLGLPVKDCTSGFKCFRRRVLEAVDFAGVASNGYGFQVEMNYLCHRTKFAIAEVPIVFPDRTNGESKMSWQIFSEAAGLVWKLRGQRATSAPAVTQGAANPSLTSAYATERRLEVPD